MNIDVLIVVPPFASPDHPAFGPSLLVAGCRSQGLRATVMYANLMLAAQVGYERYTEVTRSVSQSMFGEGLFRWAAFPQAFSAADTAAFFAASSARMPALGSRDSPAGEITRPSAALAECIDEVPQFIDTVTADILASGAKIVGFSSMFQQNLAAIAIARRLKQESGDVITVLGGANAGSPMGEALAATGDVFDHVFSGEADLLFPQFCQDLKDSHQPPAKVIDCPQVSDLDDTAIPEYDDYFSQLAPLVATEKLPAALPRWLHFESSRGCWWGARRQCNFCGLDGPAIVHRVKSTARILAEIATLQTTYSKPKLYATDNLLPPQFHDEVVPALIEAGGSTEVFVEVRPDLRGDRLDSLVRAGITKLQPGIESLSTAILRRMGKGTTAIGNLRFLRDCASRGITTIWNLLFGVPGETAADFQSIIRLLPSICHLEPPFAWGPIRIDRYSPYFQNPSDHGLGNLRPFKIYRDLYPPDSRFEDLAYHFAGEVSSELLADPQLRESLDSGLRRWVGIFKQEGTGAKLIAVDLGAGIDLIEDTRPGAGERYWALPAEQSELLQTLDRPLRDRQLSDHRRQLLGPLLERRLVVEHEGFYLSVVTRPALGLQLHQDHGL